MGSDSVTPALTGCVVWPILNASWLDEDSHLLYHLLEKQIYKKRYILEKL